jgi:hypothetical protein
VASALKVWCELEGSTVLAHTANLSRDGLFVYSPRPPPPGTKVEISIPELSLRANAEVRWRVAGRGGRSGAGLVVSEFLEGQQEYEALVKRLSSHSGEHALKTADGGVRVPRPRRNTRRTGPGTRG